MSAKIQHEFHPDAEVLSAFAEQVLGERDRGAVLKHLAVCGRCRQIVSLASEAEGAEVAAQRRAPVRPRVWFRSWKLALVPAAAIAAVAVFAIYVHQRDLERNVEMAKVERQQATEKAPMLPQASPVPPMLVAPPAAPVNLHATEERSAGPSVRPGEREQADKEPKRARVEFIDPGEGEGGPTLTAKEEQELDRALEAPAGSGAVARIPESNLEREKRAEEQKEDRHLLAAREAELTSESESGSGSSGSSAAVNNEPVDLSAQQPETQPAPAAGYLQLHGLQAMMEATTRPHALQLPSGLPALSIALAGRRLLAIDKEGALFLSEDSGTTWEKVKRQWSGHAVIVRKRANASGTTEAPPVPETAGSTPSPAMPSEANTVFELVNDQSQVWSSEDGRIWTPK